MIDLFGRFPSVVLYQVGLHFSRFTTDLSTVSRLFFTRIFLFMPLFIQTPLQPFTTDETTFSVVCIDESLLNGRFLLIYPIFNPLS